MTDQVRISDPENCVICGLSLDDHWLASCPDVASDSVERTWDGEPLWSVETRQELFDAETFGHIPGQLWMDQTTGELLAARVARSEITWAEIESIVADASRPIDGTSAAYEAPR